MTAEEAERASSRGRGFLLELTGGRVVQARESAGREARLEGDQLTEAYVRAAANAGTISILDDDIATVTVISVAVVAAYVNAGGLGTLIFAAQLIIAHGGKVALSVDSECI